MAHKLPVRTFRLRSRKILLLYAAPTIILLIIALLGWFFHLLNPGFGKFLLSLLIFVAIFLFCFTLFGLIRLRKEHFIGFLISQKGMNDVSTGHNYGLVLWKDVYKIKVVDDMEYLHRHYIVLKVNNPQEYIDREDHLHKRRSMILKYHHYGSPICFSNRALDCTFEELVETVNFYYDNYLANEAEDKTDI